MRFPQFTSSESNAELEDGFSGAPSSPIAHIDTESDRERSGSRSDSDEVSRGLLSRTNTNLIDPNYRLTRNEFAAESLTCKSGSTSKSSLHRINQVYSELGNVESAGKQIRGPITRQVDKRSFGNYQEPI